MASRALIFLVISIFGSMSANETPPQLIVWNVGQGQWVTIVDETACWHFDMGGEFAPWRAITRQCRARDNRVTLSHWDTDHINFTATASRALPKICLLLGPEGEGSERKRRWLKNLRPCPHPPVFANWSDPLGRTSNATSRVAVFRGVLVAGDSPRSAELRWSQILPLAAVQILVLGHHGSRTSTAAATLAQLTNLRMSIASARQRRYGHPHREVVEALKQARIPLLKTEDWGTVHIFL